MTQKRGPVNLRPQTHLLLDKLARKTKLSKTQLLEDAVKILSGQYKHEKDYIPSNPNQGSY